MSVRVRCKCGATFLVKDEFSGKRARCGKCQRVLLVQQTEVSSPQQGDSHPNVALTSAPDPPVQVAPVETCPHCGQGVVFAADGVCPKCWNHRDSAVPQRDDSTATQQRWRPATESRSDDVPAPSLPLDSAAIPRDPTVARSRQVREWANLCLHRYVGILRTYYPLLLTAVKRPNRPIGEGPPNDTGTGQRRHSKPLKGKVSASWRVVRYGLDMLFRGTKMLWTTVLILLFLAVLQFNSQHANDQLDRIIIITFAAVLGIASLTSGIGFCLCFAVPGEARLRGYLLLAVACLLVPVAVASIVVSAFHVHVEFFVTWLIAINGICNIATMILFVTFLSGVCAYFGDQVGAGYAERFRVFYVFVLLTNAGVFACLQWGIREVPLGKVDLFSLCHQPFSVLRYFLIAVVLGDLVLNVVLFQRFLRVVVAARDSIDGTP